MTKIPALVLNTLNFAQYPTTYHSLDTSTAAISPRPPSLSTKQRGAQRNAIDI